MKEILVTPIMLTSDSKINKITTTNHDQKSEYKGGRSTMPPTASMALEAIGEDELYRNVDSALKSIENDFIIRKAQTQLMRRQSKNSAGTKRGK